MTGSFHPFRVVNTAPLVISQPVTPIVNFQPATYIQYQLNYLFNIRTKYYTIEFSIPYLDFISFYNELTNRISKHKNEPPLVTHSVYTPLFMDSFNIRPEHLFNILTDLNKKFNIQVISQIYNKNSNKYTPSLQNLINYIINNKLATHPDFKDINFKGDDDAESVISDISSENVDENILRTI